MGLKPRQEPAALSTYLRFRGGNSDKFWEISIREASATTRWRRTDTTGQSKARDYASVELAQADINKQIQSKVKKGYVMESQPQPQSFSSDCIEPISGLSVEYDDKKRFKAQLLLRKAKVTATVLISKDKGYDAAPHNRTIAHLVKHQMDIIAALRERGCRDYLANRSYILSDWDIHDAERQLPTVSTTAQIDRAIRFRNPESNLHDGFGNLSIRCRNTWDEEHQYMVVLSEFVISDSDCLGEGVTYP